MRYPADHKQRVREQIVRAASHCFRSRGGDDVPISDLMRELHLTHGGFYRHFHGKEELFNEALLVAMDETRERLAAAVRNAPPGREVAAIVETYLGEPHCDHPGHGCPIAALASEIRHHVKSTRRTLERTLRRNSAALSRYLPGGTEAERTRAAMVLFSSMAGVLNLARAISDEELRGELLNAARAHLIAAFSPPT